MALAASVVLLMGVPATAEEQTVTLAVDGMWCASCSYIVEGTLAQVEGVKEVDVSSREKTAVVTFDDQTTTLAALTEATAGVGFPSALKQSGGEHD
jgi:mercuric ion binding protein